MCGCKRVGVTMRQMTPQPFKYKHQARGKDQRAISNL